MESTTFFLDDFEVVFNGRAIAEKLGLRSDRAEKILNELIQEAAPLARPKAVLKVCRPRAAPENKIELEGVSFNSELLSKNLAGVDKAFPYLATEGLELFKWAQSVSPAKQGFSDGIRYAAMQQARQRLEEFILNTFRLGQISEMNPGSLPIWPIVQQKELFNLLAPLAEQAGVTLLPSFLMTPGQTVSGIFFPTENKFYNCCLCLMDNCPNRKAPYCGLEGL